MKIWVKLLCIFIIRNLLKIANLFKVKNNRIVAYSYNGSQYSCNPKYIIEDILNKNGNKYQIIFAVNNINRFSYLKQKNIVLVKFKSIKFLYYSLTCKIFINNGIAPSYIPFRKSQFVLSTWHGGGAYKKGGLDTINNLPSKILMKYSAKSINGMISSCNRFTEIFHKAFLIDYKVFLNIGMPRNDILINRSQENLYAKIYKYFHIKENNKILLYAPTFRSSFKSLEENFREGDYNIDFYNIKKFLQEKFGGEWIIIYRAHYYLSGKNSNEFIDATNYPDMQELLYVSDILITDYSSCMWDFSLMYKPCFIYATDIDQYKQERDFYTPMSEWPFPIATNTDELIYNILNFNQEEYIKNVKKHHKDLGSFEDGYASERICKLIETIVNKK